MAAVPARPRRHRDRRVVGEQVHDRVHVGVPPRPRRSARPARLPDRRRASAASPAGFARAVARSPRGGRAAGCCRPRPAPHAALRRPRRPRSRARRAGSAPRAGAAAGAGAPRRTPAPLPRAARSSRRAARGRARARRPRPCGSAGPSRGSAAGPWSSGITRCGRRCDQLETAVRRDPVEPRAQRAAALEAGQRAPCAQQRVLEGVVGVVDRAEHAVAVRVQLGPAAARRAPARRTRRRSAQTPAGRAPGRRPLKARVSSQPLRHRGT